MKATVAADFHHTALSMLLAVRWCLTTPGSKDSSHVAPLVTARSHFRRHVGRRNTSGSPAVKADTTRSLWAGVRTPVVGATGINDACKGYLITNLLVVLNQKMRKIDLASLR